MPFWEGVKETTEEIIGDVVCFDMETVLLHSTSTSIATYRKSILRHLLNAAKALMPLHWKQDITLTLGQWMDGVEEIYMSESVQASLLGNEEKHVER
ncbi:Hypothetical predicted protein [Pelobates cultripes]|uniref:Uncharacterized protein n=1 Tax=Pelobates cultripes TaxID=61616 RepID=A0AAD1WR88_PELCU|nr:Hypothetical predicted protein [Pelobates cultripes]